MNTLTRLLVLTTVALLIAAVPSIEGNSSGKHSQAGSGCGCHSNMGGVTVSHNFPSSYAPGATYSIQVAFQGTGNPSGGGFNVEVSQGQLMNPGSGVQVNQQGSSATHTTSGAIVWSVDWMAPMGGTGATVVDIAVMETNGNGANSGDSWATTQVTVPEGLPPNDAPVVSNVLISPSPDAAATESLTLTYTYSDNDSDPESGQTTLHWYVDGAHKTAHNGKTTIQPADTQAGEKWKVQVTPHDGLEFGNSVMSNEVLIGDVDSDGDGVLDGQDAFPDDANETADSDNDGVGDNADDFPLDGTETTDTDGDGVGDNTDLFDDDPTQSSDTDGDGYGDNATGTNGDAFPNDGSEWADSDGDGVGDNSDAFPNDATETLDSDGDGMGDNEQAVLEARLAQEEEEAAAAQQQMLIAIGVIMILITAAVVVVLRKRMATDEDVPKDFAAGGMPPGLPDTGAQPGLPDMSAQPASVASEPVVEPMAAQPEPVAAPAEPSVVQQWTDENGNTWRVMTDGTNRWWNGTDWQKV